MKLNIRSKILLNTMVTMLLVLILGWFFSKSTQKLIETAEWVKHTHLVISKAHTIEKLAVDLETGERSFLVTGNEEYLEPYFAGSKDLDALLKEIIELVSDNPNQQSKLAAIGSLIESWKEKVSVPEIEKRRKINEGLATMKEVVSRLWILSVPN